MANQMFQFKLVFLGEIAVGKTSLITRFVKGKFDEFQETTIGFTFLTQTVSLNDVTVKFEMWDTYGFYGAAPAAIVVYDITNSESFEKAKGWVTLLQKENDSSIVIALAGNKLDLAEHRAVSTQEAQEYADNNGLLFAETSAKTGVNVNELFTLIAEKIPKNPTPPTRSAGRLLVDPSAPESKGAGSCC